MRPSGRSSASRRGSSIGSPKCMKRPPLHEPTATWPGSRMGRILVRDLVGEVRPDRSQAGPEVLSVLADGRVDDRYPRVALRAGVVDQRVDLADRARRWSLGGGIGIRPCVGEERGQAWTIELTRDVKSVDDDQARRDQAQPSESGEAELVQALRLERPGCDDLADAREDAVGLARGLELRPQGD